MPINKERVKHLFIALLFSIIAVWMLFYYLYPIFFFGEPTYSVAIPVNFEYYRSENVLVTVIIPFIVFLACIVFINFHLMECDYFCKHEGWWGLFTVLAVLFVLGGIFLFLSPLFYTILHCFNWFFMLLSLEVLGVNLFVLSRIASKRRRKIGVTSYAD